jgi:hypothetical protein
MCWGNFISVSCKFSTYNLIKGLNSDEKKKPITLTQSIQTNFPFSTAFSPLIKEKKLTQLGLITGELQKGKIGG